MVSYGSGSGSDGFVFRVTDRIKKVQGLAPKTADMLDNDKRYLSYGQYLKFRKKIRMAED